MPTSKPETRKHAVKIQRQNRQSMLMKAVSGGVVVYIPRWMKPNSPQVRKFVQEGLTQLEAHIPPARPPLRTHEDIRQMVRQWSTRMQVQPRHIVFRNMHRKWGSCSSHGNITLNTALCTIPDDLVEYVVVHELAHLRIFNHSPEFWALLGHYLPDYDSRKTRLDEYTV